MMVKFDVDQYLIVYNLSPSLGSDDDDEMAGASSQKEEENRDPGGEKESGEMNELVSNHFLIESSLNNCFDETLDAQVQQGSLIMACAVTDPDPIAGGSIYSSQFIQRSNRTSGIASTAAATKESNHQHHIINDTKNTVNQQLSMQVRSKAQILLQAHHCLCRLQQSHFLQLLTH